MRVGLFINGLVIVAAIGCGWLASRGPWTVLQRQRTLATHQVAEMRRSEAEREQLLRQEAHYKSSVGREELARAEGYLPPGQKPADAPIKAED